MHSLYLLDLDGLLVDTERAHYGAYAAACNLYGLRLPWSFEAYSQVGQGEGRTLEQELYAALPDLRDRCSNWPAFYRQKQELVARALAEGPVLPMPGARAFLGWLQRHRARCCVVTNSPRAHVEILKAHWPDLNWISSWWTREEYERAKPAPDGYLAALRAHGANPDHCLGFEDSIKGMKALNAAAIPGVWICENEPYSAHSRALGDRATWSRFSSLVDWLQLQNSEGLS